MGNRGTILFTGATASVRGNSGFAAFAGAKHALKALAQSMAREIGPEGVHVAHVIVDGQIDGGVAHGLGNALAERLAEVEPFKTVIVLKWARDWPFLLFAAAMLLPGVFIERFYCRYFCALGAALAIPARLHTMTWLKRYRQCGNPCQRCANDCMVQAIHPEGHINPNECLYCLHCQQLYYDDHICPVMVHKRQRRERAAARTTTAGQAETGNVLAAFAESKKRQD